MRHLRLFSYILILFTFISGCQSENIALQNQALQNQPIKNQTLQKQSTTQAKINLSTAKSEDFSAHWLEENLILLPVTESNKALYLVYDENQWQQKIALAKINTPQRIRNKFPHLATFQAYQVDLPTSLVKNIVKTSPLVLAADENHQVAHISHIQMANLLDDLFTKGENDANEITDFGASIQAQSVQFKLWAPTALSVKLLLFNQDKTPAKSSSVMMEEDSLTGIWRAKVDHGFIGKYYQYQLEIYHPASKKVETLITTDPYSLSLSVNSEYSQIIDLNSEQTLPVGWHQQKDNPIENPVDNIFYETHIRDFSAHDTSLSDKKYRGKYLAFTEQNSDGIKHLKALKNAGINSIHLLPTFDIGTVNEDSEQVIDLNDPISKVCRITSLAMFCEEISDTTISVREHLNQLAKNDESRQAVISAIRPFDNYNWGYDPFHYTVPEGSYAISPEGEARIVEFRTMIQHLHNLGFRVIMDVVYNHTHQAGLSPTAVLDKIVPNYYHRLDPITGNIAQSTCCDNTATERAMMEKLMIDSLLVWTKDYKIDGFRFDLMAHQPKSAMLKARAAVQAIDPDNYFYGEGWNFGEVANNQRFIQASQLELAGTEIGTFTDRLRDSVRGGAFSATGKDIRKSQGIGNGLATIPNELQGDDKSQYHAMADQLRIGLTGNLANYSLTTANNQVKLGKEINYGDQPVGYALEPADTINYVSKHDNQTLWDNNQYRIAYHVSTHDRVRMQVQSLAFAIFSQGIPFIHMGSELLRSKGFLRDSYDYSDWFNAVDFSKQSNNYDIGLPPADKDEMNWPMITELLANNEGRDIATAQDIAFSADAFIDLIQIRMSSPLFRLTSSKDIIESVHFHNTGKSQKVGLFVMSIAGSKKQASLLVIFNTAAETQSFSLPQFMSHQLHPILQRGVDPRVKQSRNNNGVFTVPALSTAVFIENNNKQ